MMDYTKQDYKKMKVAGFIQEQFTKSASTWQAFTANSIVYWDSVKDIMVVRISVSNDGFRRSVRNEVKITGNEGYCDLLEYINELKDLAFHMAKDNYIEANK